MPDGSDRKAVPSTSARAMCPAMTVRRLDMLDGSDRKAVPSTSARAMWPAMQNDSDSSW